MTFDLFAPAGSVHLLELAAALVLSSLVGLERGLRHKSAGLRTHALVGLGSALFMLVSKFGFTDVLGGDVVLDPSRVAAQIVSGIGFIGGGVIFVRRDLVRGLTTAAAIWITAAIGTACGAGLILLAVAATALHFLIAVGYPRLARRISGVRSASSQIQVDFVEDGNVLGQVLTACTSRGFSVDELTVERYTGAPRSTSRLERAVDGEPGATMLSTREATTVVELEVTGLRPVDLLVGRLVALEGVLRVHAGSDEDDTNA